MAKGHLARRASGWVVTLLAVYVVFIGALFFMQKRLMYFPDTGRFVPSEWALPEMKPLTIHEDDGLTLNSWYRPVQKPGLFTIVFCQGNAGHLGYRNYKFRPWLDAGYGLLLVGYRGFGGNPGAPSEEGLYDDARSAIDAIRALGVKDKAMVIYGESMGTGVATQMATEVGASALILESPYTSVPDVGTDRYPMVPVHILLRDKYDSLSKIKDVHMPLLLMHGELDDVVPVKFGRRLFAAANEPKQVEYVPEAGHNNVYNMRTQQLILNFLSKLPNDALLQDPAINKDEE
ncbi:MAG: alpha/beta hydrolase [Alphaproteobacteria bacterium]|nr:alpha/beta hydrolase [Alphaproteobacteria bacterium]MBV8548754.1 alpha/beta hydrolase [Alphaproteobacteria bacterium]